MQNSGKWIQVSNVHQKVEHYKNSSYAMQETFKQEKRWRRFCAIYATKSFGNIKESPISHVKVLSPRRRFG